MWSLVPESVAMMSFVSWTVSMSRVDVNPASQNWPRDSRGCCSARKISYYQEARGSWGDGSRAICVATMVSPFGILTHFKPCSTGTLLSQGQVLGRKYPVKSESAITSSNGGVTRVLLFF